MITVSILPALFILLHSVLLIRFCVDVFLRSGKRPSSLPWLLFIFFVPLVGYCNYYARYIMKREN